MNKKNNQLVRMSGQFWRMSIEGDGILLTSTVMRIRALLSFGAFTRGIIRGTIQVEGGI